MIKRTLFIGDPTYLHLQQKQLVLERDKEIIASIPIEDIGFVVIDHPQILLTQGIINALAQNKVALITTDQKHLPTGLHLPLSGHSLHSKIIDAQANFSEARKGKLWKLVVKRKIQEQITSLELENKPTQALTRLVEKVKNGDPTNIEAQAAQYYWKHIFQAPFKRDPDGEEINALLNYGYAIARAATARALVGTGLHPSLGINHQNQYNAYCLADDLMEPLRPWVDTQVVNWIKSLPTDETPHPTQAFKADILSFLNQNCLSQNKKSPFINALSTYANSIKEHILLGNTHDPIFPERIL
ncbi:type II CRISPR-associated endonuclease Cas1 [Hydrogenovibrio sp. JE_KL2]|uniref:type II CRISPR-associated endonuclease Cas1 n=1 Tax=Hydrogenovibrio sp. JE_KL2 TaxID=2651188 RepID=UPI00128BC34B|nr:type II CRISPR-associated endonuclease Cas1 [Hydrogenovibrio sp. JE_KL2]MPQ76731.1 type II CRISPR-associated endonuclease Cas1 [Hydrogenovibrio sp. JE_KL2]